MSTDPKYQALELATRVYGNNATDDNIVNAATKFYAFLTGGTAGVAAKAGKVTKVETPALDKAEAKTETPKTETPKTETPKTETPTITQEQVKQAVINLVNAGNAAAGNDKSGREYAAAILLPFGAKNVSSIKPEDYAKVLEAVALKQKAIEDEASLTS